MVYAAGKQDHTMPAGGMIDHIVDLVEARVEHLNRQGAPGENPLAAGVAAE